MSRRPRRRVLLVPALLVATLGLLAWLAGTEAERTAPTTSSVSPPAEQAVGDAAAGAQRASEASSPPQRGRRVVVQVARWPDERPIPGAEVDVTLAGLPWVRAARTSPGGQLALDLTEGARDLVLHVRAPGHAAGDLYRDSLPARGEDLVVLLQPLSGWYGRVVSAFGEPLAGVQVLAWRHWTPRPALLDAGDEEGPRITSLQATAPASVSGPTNAEGYFLVEPFDDQNVVDLVLAVADGRFSSERAHVPLPSAGPELPDLVVAGPLVLEGVVRDGQGLPRAGVEVQLDRAPGRDRHVEASVVTDGAGGFRLPAIDGLQHLRLATATAWFMGGESAEGPLPWREGWLEVAPDAGWLSLRLDDGGSTPVRAFDAATSQPLVGASASLQDATGAWQADATTGLDGRAALATPPELVGRALRLTLAADGYEAAVRDVVVVAAPTHAGEELQLHLARGVGSLPLSASVWWDAPDGGRTALSGATVSVWHARSDGPVGAWLADEGLPEGYELLWEGASDERGQVQLVTALSPSDRLFVVADVPDGDGAVHAGRWGPDSVHQAQAGIDLVVPSGRLIDVQVGGLRRDSSYRLQQTSWNPWSATTWVGQRELAERTSGWQVLALGIAARGEAFFDVRLQREPVAAPVASTSGWLALDGIDQLVLEVATPRVVEGRVAFYHPDDWPDLCVGLLGSAVAEWRSEWLGESDWCARPLRDGSYRFAAVPPGDYLFVLYRPVGSEGVEILAQRQVTVETDLAHLDVWSERPRDSELLRILER